MNKSYRIRTEVGTNADKFIKLKLEQEVDTFEILSLKINQKDIYEAFNCDYGMIVGRVNANGAVGIPNARVSIFVPISDDDKQNADIRAIYPYETPRDKNTTGKRYNLLPRVAQVQTDGTVRPKQPFGTFPTKEEVVTNDSWLEVYDKYYKFSTITNESGDYMLFGVPIGTQTVHMSVDITDIGRFSMTPATMVTNLGYSPNLFTDNGSKIKPSIDLDDLPNIETQEISIDVIPFCGDDELFDIGITRQDFRIRAELISTFIVFGNGFTDGDGEMWADNTDTGAKNIRELYRAKTDANKTVSIGTNRISNITEMIFYYPPNIIDADIQSGNVDPDSDMLLIDNSSYGSFKRNGDFVFIIPCTRNKIITDEFGNDIIVPSDSPSGVFTQFSGFITLEISIDDIPMNFSGEIGSNNGGVSPFRHKYKFPQSAPSFGKSFTPIDTDVDTLSWKKQYYTFENSKIYSVAKFHGLTFNDSEKSRNPSYSGGFISSDVKNNLTKGTFNNVGVIFTTNRDQVSNNDEKQYPSNNGGTAFGSNWMNLSIHFMQNGRMDVEASDVDGIRSNANFTELSKNMGNHFYVDNIQTIAGNIPNTKWFGRSDLHYTDFIEIEKEDILSMNNPTLAKGFTNNNISLVGTDFRNGNSNVPQGGGKLNGDPTKPTDPNFYFYKGLNESDCIQFMIDLGLV